MGRVVLSLIHKNNVHSLEPLPFFSFSKLFFAPNQTFYGHDYHERLVPGLKLKMNGKLTSGTRAVKKRSLLRSISNKIYCYMTREISRSNMGFQSANIGRYYMVQQLNLCNLYIYLVLSNDSNITFSHFNALINMEKWIGLLCANVFFIENNIGIYCSVLLYIM